MAYTDIRDEEGFILQLQRMLRDINFLEYDDASVGLSGIYDSRTQYAVMEFQKENNIPPTGVVDYDTWQSINASHIKYVEDNSVPRAVSIFPKYSGYELIPDKEDGILYVLQYMLGEIALNDEKMGVVPKTGVYDEATVNAIRQFKRRNMMDDTATVDVKTLNRIFDEYERIISSGE